MKTSKWLLLLFLSPILAIVLLTVLGLIIRSRLLISICGLVLFFALFWLFIFANRLSQFLEVFRGARSLTTRDSRRRLETLRKVSLRLALFIRGFFLSASLWVVALYLSLCEGGISAFLDQIRSNLAASVVAMVLAGIDTARGKSIEKQWAANKSHVHLGFLSILQKLHSPGLGLLGQ